MAFWTTCVVTGYAGKAKFAPQSSCEIETAAMVRMLKEERFAVQVGEFMGIEFDGPTACITDNKATYDIVRNPGATKRTAHFDRWLGTVSYLHSLWCATSLGWRKPRTMMRRTRR